MPYRAPTISGVVEGHVDEAVFRRLVRLAGAQPGPVFGKNGKDAILKKLPGYNQAARRSAWLVIVDLDHDDECAPPFQAATLPQPAPLMCFRVAVREVEAWLMGDAERLAAFLRVPVSRIPNDPDALDEPKRRLVAIAAESRSPEIRQDMVPRPGGGREVGPAYTSRLIEFVSPQRSTWRPKVAARRSESLRRCMRAVADLVKEARSPIR